ncbi:MAG: Crp/Fnr family transcriptional regulator [Bacillota bacterium]
MVRQESAAFSLGEAEGLLRTRGHSTVTEVRRYRPGQIVALDHGRVYYVRDGLVQLWEVHPDGRELLTDIIQPDSAFEVADSGLSAWYELRVLQVTALHIMRWHEVKHDTMLMYEVLSKLRENAVRRQELAAIMRQKFVDWRLAAYLRFLLKWFGNPAGEGMGVIPLPLTHEQLACAIDSTRATVTRILRDYEDRRTISYVRIGGSRLIELKGLR